jgi:class 3 adenylate cyclase
MNVIVLHNGDIVKFVGDAVIFYWKSEEFIDADDESHEALVKKGHIVLRACECCMELLTKLSDYDISIPGVISTKLKIHLGVGAGQIFDVHVGGTRGRWEHFIAGDAVQQISMTLDLARPGITASNPMF